MNETSVAQSSFSITELAREFSVTTRTIRHYEDEGLISPQRNGMQRVYSKRDRVRLQLILRGKRLGFSLAEIREIIDMYQLPHGEQQQARLLQSKIAERRAALEQQKIDIENMLSELDRLEERMNTTVRGQ